MVGPEILSKITNALNVTIGTDESMRFRLHNVPEGILPSAIAIVIESQRDIPLSQRVAERLSLSGGNCWNYDPSFRLPNFSRSIGAFDKE